MLAAISGFAQHADSLPDTLVATNDDERAWKAYAEIMFCLYKPGMTPDGMRAACSEQWELLRTELAFQAVTPLIHFDRSQFMSEKSPMALLAKTFPNEVRCVLEFGLKHLGRLTNHFGSAWSESLPTFVVNWLSRVGTVCTAALLECHLDSPLVGAEVAKAVKALRNGF